ncbi:MAG: hypothetical protein OXE55_06690, partial [Flavobacteriaceae bacterium]|nr:hypothetical protein [Flavobacteriaceae bacterium]
MIGPRNDLTPIMAFQESVDGTLSHWLADVLFKRRLEDVRGDHLFGDGFRHPAQNFFSARDQKPSLRPPCPLLSKIWS